MTTTTIARPGRPAEPPPEATALPAAPTPAPSSATGRPPNEKPPDLPLAGRLRLNLSALGIDPNAPDFGERLCQLSQDNVPYDFEISAPGELIIMPPSGWESSANECVTSGSVGNWQDANGGLSFAPTAMFNLPSGARYMPDASWITQERYEQLLAQEYRSTIDGAPDFVVEVRSRTDNLAAGLAKMQEWMDGGARLGWYLDPYETRAYIYRPRPARCDTGQPGNPVGRGCPARLPLCSAPPDLRPSSHHNAASARRCACSRERQRRLAR